MRAFELGMDLLVVSNMLYTAKYCQTDVKYVCVQAAAAADAHLRAGHELAGGGHHLAAGHEMRSAKHCMF